MFYLLSNLFVAVDVQLAIKALDNTLSLLFTDVHFPR